MRLEMFILTCNERMSTLRNTIALLGLSDWETYPIIYTDPQNAGDPRERQTLAAERMLYYMGLYPHWDFAIFAEDDVSFSDHLRHNIKRWSPLQDPDFKIGSLYSDKPQSKGTDHVMCHTSEIFGSQAIIFSRQGLRTVLKAWNEPRMQRELQDGRIYRAINDQIPIYQPNQAQHRPVASTWGGKPHQSPTFDPDWQHD